MVVCKIMMDSLPNENTRRGGQSSRIGVDTGASPRTYHTDIGVSPSSAPRRKDDPPETDSGQEQEDTVWFLMRAAYGQERKAKEVLEADNIEVFLPMTNKMHLVNGKRKCITESLIPNFLFVHSTERLMKKIRRLSQAELFSSLLHPQQRRERHTDRQERQETACDS